MGDRYSTNYARNLGGGGNRRRRSGSHDGSRKNLRSRRSRSKQSSGVLDERWNLDAMRERDARYASSTARGNRSASASYGSRSARNSRSQAVPQLASERRQTGALEWLRNNPPVAFIGAGLVVLLVVGLIATGVQGRTSTSSSSSSSSTGTSTYGISSGDRFLDEATNGDSTAMVWGVGVEGLQVKSLNGLTITGPSFDEKVTQPLQDAIKAIENEGYSVGISLVDTTNGIAIEYNSDSAFYSASSIKGPYVAALGEYELGEAVTVESSRISNTLEWSDNDAYASLRYAYGNDCLAKLIADCGAADLASVGVNDECEEARQQMSAESISDNNYEFLTPNQLAAMWMNVDEYLSSGEAGASYLAEEFAQPETSGIKYVGKAYGTTWSKAGWYDEGSGAYSTTVDAGVIREETGDVVCVVMLTKGNDFTALDSVALPLLQLHEALLGD